MKDRGQYEDLSGTSWRRQMDISKILRFVLLTAIVSVRAISGQEPHQHQHDATEKLGRVSFPVSCQPAAQQKFNRALALLHSFQYVDAELAFTEIRASDPTCAMAWWGEAMSAYHPLWQPPTPAELRKGQEAVGKAGAANAKTARERDYITSLETFYKDADKLSHWERARAYAASMEGVYRRYPQDREAAIFYALALNGAAPASEKNLANRAKAAQILYRAWSHEQDHPGVAHYLIHSYDYPSLARLALPAARRYSRVAPSSAHALHMPSHIFTRLGMWPDSIQSNLASAAAAKQRVAIEQPGAASQDQLHAMDYLMYAYLQGAQDDRAKSILDEALAYGEVDQVVFQAAYAWTAIPARFALERRSWKEAASLTLHPVSFPWERFRFAEANIHFARAVGAARSGGGAVALQEINLLDSIQAEMGGAKTGYDWATQVQIQRDAAAAWLAQAEGKSGEAERLMRAAAGLEDSTDKHPVTPGAILPAREMLGDLLIELKRPAQALKEYEAVLRTAPNRFNSLYGAAHAAELTGNRQKARAYYTKLTTICSHGAGQRPELQLAKGYLARK
jgi:Tfp pilus assembly protein PilF